MVFILKEGPGSPNLQTAAIVDPRVCSNVDVLYSYWTESAWVCDRMMPLLISTPVTCYYVWFLKYDLLIELENFVFL